MDISALAQSQRRFFASGRTLDPAFRKAALRTLAAELKRREELFARALTQDLGKSRFEGYLTETGLVLDELHFHLSHLDRWLRPRRCKTPLSQMPGRSFVFSRPKGCVLIVSPWNYPLQLSLEPLAGAISAGCCAILKPSAYAPAVSRALKELIDACFSPEYIAVVEGGREENALLFEEKFDHLFFTGSPSVGRLAMEKAARHLCPVTLELGGKSPCLVDETADIPAAARRIVFGKFLNCGQTCVAPDYVLCHERVRAPLLQALRDEITRQFGPEPLRNRDYGKIVNKKHFRRLLGLLEGQSVQCGGRFDEQALRIEPTVLHPVAPDSPVMGEEIFGPLLPVLTWSTLSEAIQFIRQRPHPLALYLFTRSAGTQRAVFSSCRFGGGCVNDTVIHLATSHMPFGGVGESGMGGYHGKASFDTFSHSCSVMKKPPRLELPVRYQPYTPQKERLLRRFLK